MDRRTSPDRAATARDRVGPDGGAPRAVEPVLPSRAGALAECHAALGRTRGPVLLTGEAGSGKSWLWRHLADTSTGLGRWLGLDAAPSDAGRALVRHALRGLGRADAFALDDPRAALADELAEHAQEGRRWVLVLDEAQNATDAALEEFRLRSNRLGRPDGFAGLVLVGRTGLGLRLRDRAWASLESRLAAHVQLGPIDAEEAAALLRWYVPSRSWTRAQVEAMHARSLGNAARLIRLADRTAIATASRVEPRTSPTPSIAPTPPPEGRPASPAPAAASPESFTALPATADPIIAPAEQDRGEPTIAPAPRLAEARPPLRFEEGLIEVGWSELDDDPSPEPSAEGVAGPALDRVDGLEPVADDADVTAGLLSEGPVGPVVPTTEAIDDPYAAIQARAEWSIAVEAARSEGGDTIDDDPWYGSTGPLAVDDEGASPRRAGQVRAEAGQEFAPYSRLFSQLNSSSDAD